MAVFNWDEVSSHNRVQIDNEGIYESQPSEGRSFAHLDGERIINSTAFRRLQGKTQVYPFPRSDSIRNRLTHTIEVSYIGQAIAANVMRLTRAPDSIKALAPQIVSNGCLLHDIGNPPFGHSGEESIREFFRNEANKYDITKIAWRKKGAENDFLFFDGNAQGFRIATTLNGWKYKGGLRLSSSTLCAMVKYPYGSSDAGGKPGKFGYMASEANYFVRVFEDCGLRSEDGRILRSPYSLIVEAADDIGYLTADMQDAQIYGDLTVQQVEDELIPIAGPYNTHEYKELTNERDQIAYIRSCAVGNLIEVASRNISENYFQQQKCLEAFENFEVWSGRDNSPSIKFKVDKIRLACKKRIYRGREKITNQVAGGRIIKFILETQISAFNEFFQWYISLPRDTRYAPSWIKFEGNRDRKGNYIDCIMNGMDEHISKESAQVIRRLPEEAHERISLLLLNTLRDDMDEKSVEETLAHSLLQLCVDFVSGTTDRYISEYSKAWGGPALT